MKNFLIIFIEDEADLLTVDLLNESFGGQYSWGKNRKLFWHFDRSSYNKLQEDIVYIDTQ